MLVSYDLGVWPLRSLVDRGVAVGLPLAGVRRLIEAGRVVMRLRHYDVGGERRYCVLHRFREANEVVEYHWNLDREEYSSISSSGRFTGAHLLYLDIVQMDGRERYYLALLWSPVWELS